MTTGFKLTLLWIAGSMAALVVALAPVSAAFVDGHYVPIGPDAFYHARRILDAVAESGSFYEFDHFMHVPEGSLIAWPWGYDYLMSLIVRAAMALNVSEQPMTIMAHVPSVTFIISIALMLVIARRLALSMPATAIALFATAFFPLNQTLYGVGSIDHHFAEHVLVLATLATALGWFRNPQSSAHAIATAVILGIAPAIHNGLFILQIPLVLTVLLLWVTRKPVPAMIPFAATLFVVTLLVGLPSTALREGRFEFYTLSWFHVYASACTAIACVLMSRVPFSPRNLAVFLVGSAVLAAPLADQFVIANKFLSATVEGMSQISEARSLVRIHEAGGFEMLATHYSLLLFLLPLTAIFAVWRALREPAPDMRFFWVSCVFGLALLVLQMRLHYFGSFALYLPWLVAAQQWAGEADVRRKGMTWCAVAAVFAIAFAPGIRHKLFERGVVSGDPYYDVTRAIYPAFSRACAEHPGVALADPDDGHYVRFHTNCSVIANPFLLTAQHEEKIRRVHHLFELSPAELLTHAPDVRYVYARRGTLFFLKPNGEVVFAPAGDPRDPDPPLIRTLLSAPRDKLPHGFRLIEQLTLDDAGNVPYARLLAIDPGT